MVSRILLEPESDKDVETMNCYVCTERITDGNKTEEHILLNSIGGRLKSNYIICKQCNSEFGEDIDSDLSNQLNFIANMLNLKRERGEPQRVSGKSVNGEDIWMEPGGKPSMKKPIIKLDEKGKKLTVVAPRMKGLKKQLEGLRRKYPTINMDELGKAEVKREYLSERYHFDQVFGGEKTFRSICKKAVNFYMHYGGKKETISHLIDYIKNGSESDSKVAAFYYPEQQQEVIPKNDGEILHSIILKGSSDNRILYCYVELFNLSLHHCL